MKDISLDTNQRIKLLERLEKSALRRGRIQGFAVATFFFLVLVLFVGCESIDYEDPGELEPSEAVIRMPGCEQARLLDPEIDC